MAKIISMPQLSDTMEEGTLVKWNKKIGDKILEGDILAEIETDKAIQDFEVDTNGILLFIGVKEGEKTRVNDIIAIIGKEGEDINHLIKKENIVSSSNDIHKKDRELISPLAKKIAKKINISTTNIKGSGDYGRIIKRDIELLKNNDKKNKEYYNKIPHSYMRKQIAKNLSYSKYSAPHYYLFSDIYVDKLIEFRKNINNQLFLENRISFNDIIIKASANSLKKNPNINVSWNEEYTYYNKSINIGFAVAIKEGLLVPVINNADKKSILQISKEIKDKIIRSKLKKLKIEEMKNSTFTVSNLGMFGIDSFTSIINSPNSSILSIGSIIKKPIVINSEIVIGNVMRVTLSCDHRVIDGAMGSSYINYIKKLLENPIKILL